MAPPPLTGSERHLALPASEVLAGRNAWLIHLRWLAVVGTILFTQIAARTLPVELHTRRITLLALALALYNVVAWLVQRQICPTQRRAADQGPDEEALARAGLAGDRDPGDRPNALGRLLLPRTSVGSLPYDRQSGCAAILALVQITIDLIFLAALVHLTGGVESPAWVFFTFHVIFASVLLSTGATYAVAALGTMLMTEVLVGELMGVLPHRGLGGHWGLDSYLQPEIVGGYLFVRGATLFTTAYLASSITGRLRRREVDVFVLTRHLVERAERLQAAYKELSIAEKSKSQYMRKVAHELRQPLGTLKTALTVALQNAGESLDQQTRTLIERAERKAGALAEMTQELLSLSRARGGRAAVELAPVAIAEVAGRVLEEQRQHALEKGLALATDVEPGLPPVLGDPEGLADLIVNLVGNAIRYTPAGGSVWFRARREVERLVVEVEDTGIGILEADRARVFEDFYRSPAARELAPQGSGLGLAIVRAVVEQHQGSIAVEGREGGGTRFRVELPLAEMREPVPAS